MVSTRNNKMIVLERETVFRAIEMYKEGRVLD